MTPTDHDLYVAAQVRKGRIGSMKADLRTAMGAARGRLSIEDILTILAEEHGFTFNDATRFFCERQSEVAKRYAAYAHENISDEGDLEIDATAMVSLLEDNRGAYVMGWKWVDQADAGITPMEQARAEVAT